MSAPVHWSTSTATLKSSAPCIRPTSSTENAEPANTATSAEDPAPAPSPTPATPSAPTPSAPTNQERQNPGLRNVVWIANFRSQKENFRLQILDADCFDFKSEICKLKSAICLLTSAF